MREKHKKIVMLFIFRVIFYSAAIQAEIKTLVYAQFLERSMFPGQRFQFSAWARIDRPWEGTYFPDDIDLVDETRDTETDELYSTACIPQATATSTLYCGKDISSYSHVEIVS